MIDHQAPIIAPWWQVVGMWLAFAVMPLSLIACVDVVWITGRDAVGMGATLCR